MWWSNKNKRRRNYLVFIGIFLSIIPYITYKGASPIIKNITIKVIGIVAFTNASFIIIKMEILQILPQQIFKFKCDKHLLKSTLAILQKEKIRTENREKWKVRQTNSTRLNKE